MKLLCAIAWVNFVKKVKRRVYIQSTKEIILPITPVAKPRMTQRDKWNPSQRAIAYRAYKDELRLCLHEKGLEVEDIPTCCHLLFFLPMPPSWSQKKKSTTQGMPHLQRPDKDNLEKGFWDALLEEDCKVWDTRVTKLWGTEGQIVIKVMKPFLEGAIADDI